MPRQFTGRAGYLGSVPYSVEFSTLRCSNPVSIYDIYVYNTYKYLTYAEILVFTHNRDINSLVKYDERKNTLLFQFLFFRELLSHQPRGFLGRGEGVGSLYGGCVRSLFSFPPHSFLLLVIIPTDRFQY